MTMVRLRSPQVKMIYACLITLFLTATASFAQDQRPGDERQPPSADDIVAKMQTKLNLTRDQVTAVTPIIEKFSSKREELHQSMEDGTADRDSLRSQMKLLKTDEDQELSQVLSAEQMGQWEQMMSQRKRHSHTEGGGPSQGNATDGAGHMSDNGGEGSGGNPQEQ